MQREILTVRLSGMCLHAHLTQQLGRADPPLGFTQLARQHHRHLTQAANEIRA